MLPKINNTKLPLLAVIREAECIGCTKCIQACPADAILGSATFMHTVITDECIGCKLCVAPCPVDCIDMVPVTKPSEDKFTRKKRAENFKKRYRIRKIRLQKDESAQLKIAVKEDVVDEKKAYILAVLERTKLKKKLNY